MKIALIISLGLVTVGCAAVRDVDNYLLSQQQQDAGRVERTLDGPIEESLLPGIGYKESSKIIRGLIGTEQTAVVADSPSLLFKGEQVSVQGKYYKMFSKGRGCSASCKVEVGILDSGKVLVVFQSERGGLNKEFLDTAQLELEKISGE